jgi:hypothetical protein
MAEQSGKSSLAIRTLSALSHLPVVAALFGGNRVGVRAADVFGFAPIFGSFGNQTGNQTFATGNGEHGRNFNRP